MEQGRASDRRPEGVLRLMVWGLKDLNFGVSDVLEALLVIEGLLQV